MKWVYRLILPVLLLFSVEAKSQTYNYIPFPDSSYSWKGYTACIGGGGNWSVYLRGDTIISGIIYKNIGYIGSIREDTSKRIFFYNHQQNVNYERLLYNFSFSVGDTISSLATGQLLTVFLVDTPDYFGVHRRSLHLRSNGGTYVDTWIEGIGSVLGPLGLSRVSPGYCPYSILCQAYNDSLLVFEINDQRCSSATSISEVNISYAVKTYPNPATISFTLQLSTAPNTPTYFQLYDAMGRQVRQEEINSISTTINRHQLSNGIYFWQLQQGNKILERGKLVME